MAKNISLPITVPDSIFGLLKKVKRSLAPPRPSEIRIDIGGERNIEWSFISSEIPGGPGEAIEFGCEQGYMSLVAAQRGFQRDRE